MLSKKNKRNGIVLLFLLAVCAYFAYQYIYQEHRDIKAETPEYVITAKVIGGEFMKSPLESEKKYLNKTIVVLGSVTEFNKNDLTLNHMVFCQFSNSLNPSIKINTNLKIKGRCIGYDDLLEQVKLDQCTIIN